MKILLVNQILYTPADGIIPKVSTIKDTMIYQMCLGFIKSGHEVVLAASCEYMPENKESYPFEVLWFKSNHRKMFPPTLLPYSREFLHFLRKHHHEYDLIITKEVFSLSSLMVCRICPKKTLIWVEQAAHQRKFHKIPSKIWLNIVARYFMKGAVVVPCSERARLFLYRYLPGISCEIVEHGIDLEKFKPAEAKRRQLIVSSQLIKRKNIESIIPIFSSLHKESGYEDIKLLIAGRGPEEDFLKEVASSEGVADYVELLGFLSQADLNGYIAQSLALLVNTRSDMNMVSVPESICSCTPVVMNEVPLNGWYVKKFGLGIVRDGWGINELKEVIDRNGFYVNNCMHYRNELSVVRSAQKLIAVFQ